MKSRTGVTIIEITIAVFIFAAAFIPIIKVVTFGSVSTVKNGLYSKAAQLAQQLVEECKHVPIKVYEDLYYGMEEYKGEDTANTIQEVSDHFYSKTAEKMNKFIEEEKKKGTLDKFGHQAYLRVKKNELGQMKEIWFDVEIFWNDKGYATSTAGINGYQHHVRYANAYYNSEAM